ncbi:hypothetical protein CNMCM6106_008287 [Aspergillus hiratsukae]|uniref:Uncharacterized protein n=1 Tax=Aspergillus hiratsukae TaxID=1194566 RepID=A0A8H6QKG5_9EURO|nr:hypothetical protein CNMCM6106_008287 [Aspergillus hiratsukae]
MIVQDPRPDAAAEGHGPTQIPLHMDSLVVTAPSRPAAAAGWLDSRLIVSGRFILSSAARLAADGDLRGVVRGSINQELVIFLCLPQTPCAKSTWKGADNEYNLSMHVEWSARLL